MEKKQQTANPQVQEEVDIVGKAKQYRKQITAVTVAVILCVVAVLGWYLVRQSQAAKADQAIALAEVEQNDSIALDLYKKAAELGTKSGNRAKVIAAIRLYGQGDYEQALQYLNDASIDDEIVAAGVESLKGDCYVNLKNFDAAIKAFKAAVKAANKNPQLVPIFLVKEANVYRAQKDYDAEVQAYKMILDEYPTYGQATGVDINKYYQRALDASQK